MGYEGKMVKHKGKWVDSEEVLIDRVIAGLKNSEFSCLLCKHLNKNGISCNAFPKVIPHDLIAGLVRHTERYLMQDNDIFFEKGENPYNKNLKDPK